MRKKWLFKVQPVKSRYDSPRADRVNADGNNQLMRGFTFIEVLIAVAVLSTAIIFVFRSFTSSIESSRFAQDISLAYYFLEDRLWDTEQDYLRMNDFPLSGKNTQETENEKGKFTWNYEIGDSPYEDLKLFNFGVSWRRLKEKEHSLGMLTYLYKEI